MRDRTARKAPQAAGMIVSNELGYYKTGEYGIRIENPVLVGAREIDGAEGARAGVSMFEKRNLPLDRLLDRSVKSKMLAR
jgi:Xaa-Pro aminopeptidase